MLSFDYRSGRAVPTRIEMMAQRVGELERKVNGLGDRFEAMGRKFEELPTKTDLKAVVDEIGAQVKFAAGGFGRNLDALRRDIKRLSVKVARKDR